ncbi:hypothetical protein L2E82_27539 [Cichorium intybus]|uniref:Uncharacterized protein n=1 Tax=Cichorium intybus TaxID=13427 RepID=A0ACB9CTD2_CICIN|nr:hypothetical protein L2E82_27539 [Cichorium intybus]
MGFRLWNENSRNWLPNQLLRSRQEELKSKQMGGEVISMTTKWKKKEDKFADFENEIETDEFAGFENEIEFAGFEKEENEIETDGRGSDLSCLQWTTM